MGAWDSLSARVQYLRGMTAKSSSSASIARTPSYSEVHMTELVLPSHTNQLGGIFGGQLMSWIDVAAAIVAQRHAGRTCVTASIDELHFLRPIRLGHVVNIHAKITAVHRTSCEVMVTVDGENPFTGERFHTGQAYLTFVSLGDDGKPTPMPALNHLTPVEKRHAEDAELRREHRVRLKAALSAREPDIK